MLLSATQEVVWKCIRMISLTQTLTSSVCGVYAEINRWALCQLDRPEMGHKRVTVQQRLLWDWSMKMEREHVWRLELQKQSIAVFLSNYQANLERTSRILQKKKKKKENAI